MRAFVDGVRKRAFVACNPRCGRVGHGCLFFRIRLQSSDGSGQTEIVNNFEHGEPEPSRLYGEYPAEGTDRLAGR